MPAALPHLRLTLGQAAWVLSGGQPPSKRVIDQLRYLRQLGIPFGDEDPKPGRGVRAAYSYDHLVEMGVALFAVQRGMRPQDAAQFITGDRPALHSLFRRAFLEQPNEALLPPAEDPWITQQKAELGGRWRAIQLTALKENDHFLRLHDRYSDQSGRCEMLTIENLPEGLAFGDYVEHYPDGRSYPLVPLSRLVIAWTRLALQAPPSKRGRET